MKNVRHDCFLNPLIWGYDPINHDKASATNAPRSIGEGKGPFVCQLFPLPCLLSTVLVVAFAELNELEG